MINKEFIRRMLSTKKANLKYFLKLYFKDETKFYIEDKETMKINGFDKEIYNLRMIINKKEIWGFAILNKKLNGFVLIIPQAGKAIRFIMSNKKRTAKVEHFIKAEEGTYFKSKYGNYLKERKESITV